MYKYENFDNIITFRQYFIHAISYRSTGFYIWLLLLRKVQM